MEKSINKELFQNAIDPILLELRPIRETLSNSTIEFFQKYSVPEILKDFLTANSFDRSFQVGHIYYDRTNDAAKQNLEDENSNCIQEGLLIIGCGLNGDPVVVDMETLTVGFIFHDLLWENPTVKARAVFIDTGLGIGEFYWKAANEKESFPKDAYQAKDIYGKLKNGR